MWARSVNPAYRMELLPGYPSSAAIDAANGIVNSLVSETTPTPSVVPGDTGVVEFIWQKSGWDLMFTVGDSGSEVWARFRPTGETVVHGSGDEDGFRFAEILASL